MHSRREKARIPVKLNVSIRHGNDEWKTLTKDISAGGVLVEWCDRHPLVAGTIVQVQMESTINSPLAVATVVRANPGGVALNFIDEAPRSSPDALNGMPAALSADRS